MTPTELHAALAALGMTHAALAAELGVARETVTRWCSGRLAMPKMAETAVEGMLLKKTLRGLADVT